MDPSLIPEPLRARMAGLEARSSLQRVRDLLQTYVMDADGLDEVRADMAQTAQVTTRYLRADLDALRSVLADDLPPGTLLRLVADDGNWGLGHDATDAGAAAFLRDLAGILQSVLDGTEGTE